MKRPRIYADFHRLDPSPRDPTKVVLSLDRMGTLRDLCLLGVRLVEDLELTVYSDSSEDEDLEADAIAFFDQGRRVWFAELEESSIRDVPIPPAPTDAASACELVCFRCRMDLSPQIKRQGLDLGDVCSSCGSAVHEPIHPPS